MTFKQATFVYRVCFRKIHSALTIFDTPQKSLVHQHIFLPFNQARQEHQR
jgi:hypothetical protein